MTDGATRWSALLDGWSIEPEILAAAPESPWGFPPELWGTDGSRTGDDHEEDRSGLWRVTPSRTVQAARDALPLGGTVIDVGCGGGAGSVPLGDTAGRIVAVDQSAGMLQAYAAAVRRTGHPCAVELVEGTWPQVAAQAGTADIVVAANVVYNVADIVPFVRALDAAAARRVVLELPVAYGQAALAELWWHFHGVERPSGPMVSDLLAVLAESGFRPVLWRWDKPPLGRLPSGGVLPAYAAFVRRRLCLPVDREDEVIALLAAQPLTSQPVATVWWDVQS